MLPLSRVLMLYSSGSSVESVEHPCPQGVGSRVIRYKIHAVENWINSNAA